MENRCCLLIGDFNVRIASDQSTPEELDIGARLEHTRHSKDVVAFRKGLRLIKMCIF